MTDTPTPFGHFHPPREEWLAKAEPEVALEPDLPIIDTHHHLWAWGRRYQYLLQELRADADDVWKAVSDFSRYPELISTVRTATAYDAPEGTGSEAANVCRYNFLVSRIRLVLNVRFVVDDSQRYASWQLDRPSWVLLICRVPWFAFEMRTTS